MKTIESHEDVQVLVNTFYSKIRKDDLLGPVFNGQIREEQWPLHLEKLVNFWITALFGIVCFKGNPGKAHAGVDKKLDYTINQIHFERWLQLWYDTIDRLYVGKLAQRAKDAAKSMAANQYLVIQKLRPHHQ